jgi:hypothetical protein
MYSPPHIPQGQSKILIPARNARNMGRFYRIAPVSFHRYAAEAHADPLFLLNHAPHAGAAP